MSNSHLFLAARVPKAPLQNGLGRYVCQLQRITIKYCKSNGGSKGVRDFLENQLLDFSTKNPGITVYVKPRRNRGAVIVAEYLNGDRHWKSVNTYSEELLTKWLGVMITQHGDAGATRIKKLWYTDCPSIQGAWTPFTHQNPELTIAKFPDAKYSAPLNQEPTATEKLLELFKKQQLDDSEKFDGTTNVEDNKS